MEKKLIDVYLSAKIPDCVIGLTRREILELPVESFDSDVFDLLEMMLVDIANSAQSLGENPELWVDYYKTNFFQIDKIKHLQKTCRAFFAGMGDQSSST